MRLLRGVAPNELGKFVGIVGNRQKLLVHSSLREFLEQGVDLRVLGVTFLAQEHHGAIISEFAVVILFGRLEELPRGARIPGANTTPAVAVARSLSSRIAFEKYLAM